MKSFYRFLSIFLAMILMCSLGACAKNAPESTGESVVFTNQNTEDTEQLEVPISEEVRSDSGTASSSGQLSPTLDEGEQIISACVRNDCIYILTRVMDQSSGAVQSRIYAMEADGSNKTLIVSETFTAPGASQEMSYLYSIGIQSFCVCSDGSVWYKVNDLTSLARQVVHADMSGNELASIDSEGVSFLLPLSDGGAAIFADALTVVYADGQTRFSIQPDNGWWDDAAVLDDGSVAVVFRDFMSNTIYLKRLDLDAGALVTVSEMTVKNVRLAGGSWDALWLFGGNVSVWEPDSDTLTQKLNFSSEGLNFSDIRDVELMSGDRLLISEQKITAVSEEIALYILTAGDSMRVQSGDATVLRLAGVSIPYPLTEAILAFNRTNGEYTIEIEDYFNYSTADNYNAGKERLLYEIGTGDLPDIIYFGNDLSVEDMASKGYLVDIGALLDADSSIDRSELMENVLDAAEIGGTLYSLPMSYYVETAMGRKDIVGANPCTVDNVRTWIEQNPTIEAYSEMTRDLFLRRLVWTNADTLIDSGTGTCRFDSAEFIGMLELANKLPAITQERVSAAAHDSLFIPEYATTLGSLAGGDYGAAVSYEITGYPGTIGGLTLISPDPELGIASNAANIDGCWTFLRYLLSKEAQEAIAAFDGIPILCDVFDAQLETLRELCSEGLFTEAMVEAAAETASGGGVCIRSSSMLTQLSGIAVEEAESYFSGDKSAEETAAMIQSRASLYMSEQG